MCNFLFFFDLKNLEKFLYFFQKFITVINPLPHRCHMAVKPHLNLIVTGHIDNGK
ncbi:MAG: elongation factor 1-alpha, partial [Nitrosopumilales archaeon CG_4_10_14_0_8_um_filter_34_8]